MPWFVYILECSNGTLYVGSTENLARRFDRHISGDAAAHTAKCPPQRLIWSEEHLTLAAAIARERQLKGWSRAKKLPLAQSRLGELKQLAKRRSA
jgi:putative endonuclease